MPILRTAAEALLLSVTVAALLLAWCGVATATPPEGLSIAIAVLALATGGMAVLLAGIIDDARRVRTQSGGWWGLDAWVRTLATPLALGGCLALVVWALARASVGAKLGGAGSLLVLLVVIAVSAKFVAETYLFAQLGGEPSPRQASAAALNGRLAGWSKLRYALGALGGIILPLGAQMLAGGAKNIPAVTDAGPPAALALVALFCLLPAEALERWLDRVAAGPTDPQSADGASPAA